VTLGGAFLYYLSNINLGVQEAKYDKFVLDFRYANLEFGIL
jgi:hypothetical protein